MTHNFPFRFGFTQVLITCWGGIADIGIADIENTESTSELLAVIGASTQVDRRKLQTARLHFDAAIVITCTIL